MGRQTDEGREGDGRNEGWSDEGVVGEGMEDVSQVEVGFRWRRFVTDQPKWAMMKTEEDGGG